MIVFPAGVAVACPEPEEPAAEAAPAGAAAGAAAGLDAALRGDVFLEAAFF